MKIERIILYTVLVLAIPVVANIISPGIVGIPKLISGLFLAYITYCLYMSQQYEDLDGKILIKIWIWILIIGSVRAFIFNTSSYTEFRNSLLSLLDICIVLSVFLGSAWNLKKYLSCFEIIMIPCAIFSALYWKSYGTSDVAHILYPNSLFMLLLPYLKNRQKIIILAISFFSLFYDVSVRSNVLLLGGSTLLLIVFYLSKNDYILKFRKFIWYTFMVLPLILLLLGVIGKYNVFRELMSSDIHIEVSGSKNRSNYLTDSRTMVYLDVFTSIDGVSGWLLGYSPVSKIKTHMAENDSAYKKGRNSTECGFLNILFRYGVIGAFCFFLMLAYSSYLGLFKSNNKLAMLIGAFVAFKFLFVFIEEPNISMTTYFAIGLCLNSNFRNMSDEQLKEIFSI